MRDDATGCLREAIHKIFHDFLFDICQMQMHCFSHNIFLCCIVPLLLMF